MNTAVAARRAEQIREQQRATWGAAAPGWVRRRRETRDAGTAVTGTLIEMTDIRPGQRVLNEDALRTLAGMSTGGAIRLSAGALVATGTKFKQG